MVRLKQSEHWFCEVWQVNFYFCIGWEWRALQVFAKGKIGFDIDDREEPEGISLCNRHGTIIWIREGQPASTIAHECLHAANHNLGMKGVKADFFNDEAQAYLLGALFERAAACILGKSRPSSVLRTRTKRPRGVNMAAKKVTKKASKSKAKGAKTKARKAAKK